MPTLSEPFWRRFAFCTAGLLLVAGLAIMPRLGAAQDWTFGPFERPEGVNPLFTPDTTSTLYSPMRLRPVRWEALATFNPAAAVHDGRVHVLYRAEDDTGQMMIGGHTSRIGLATSADGLRFRREPAPVLYPERDLQKENEWPGGVEDPRVVATEDGRYVMTYTQWNREQPRLAVATSRDLRHWVKHGPLFPNLNRETKSGAIVTRRDGNRLVATRINGRYWMYWGVPTVHAATSTDLIHWTPVTNRDGTLLDVLSARPGHFDSWLVEAGPPAVLTNDGIVVLYNAGNDAERGDPDLPDSTYSAGQALYDPADPTRLIARTDGPFLKPERRFERTGQYARGTTFVEGLVPFEGRWFLYYGAADSRVGVAVWDPSTGRSGE